MSLENVGSDIVTQTTRNTTDKGTQRIVGREGIANVMITGPVTAQESRGRAVATAAAETSMLTAIGPVVAQGSRGQAVATAAGGGVQTDRGASEVRCPVKRVASGSHES